MSDSFTGALPFPHEVVYGLWADDLLLRAAAEFPSPEDLRWEQYADPRERGKKAGDRSMWGPTVTQIFDILCGEPFVGWLEELTEIGPLTPDVLGGGLHMTGEGGRLASHVDFNRHPTLDLERRVNVLVFLNEDWDDSWGGVLELGTGDDVLRVSPQLNSTVVFETSATSWHGHPEPIVGDHLRKSLACYYYAPVEEGRAAVGSTIFGGE